VIQAKQILALVVTLCASQYPERVEHFKRLFAAAHEPSKHFVFGKGRPNAKKKAKKKAK